MTKGVGCISFLCRNIRFCVAIGNGHNKGFAVATKLARPGVFCHNIMFLCYDRVWPNEEILCCNRAILCRDIVG